MSSNWSSLQNVKQIVDGVMPKNSQLSLEAFHVKTPSDILDGTLMVPKVIVVAKHVVGRLLIDDETDSGQIDHIYDAICDTGGKTVRILQTLETDWKINIT